MSINPTAAEVRDILNLRAKLLQHREAERRDPSPRHVIYSLQTHYHLQSCGVYVDLANTIPAVAESWAGSEMILAIAPDDPWGISFKCMFDMSADSHLFWTADQLEEIGAKKAGNIYSLRSTYHIDRDQYGETQFNKTKAMPQQMSMFEGGAK